MKRPLLIALLLLALDQITKLLAMTYLDGRQLMLNSYLGLSFVKNYGLWVRSDLPAAYLLPLQILTGFIILGVALYVLLYKRFYRKSIWIDLFLACLVAAYLGNMVVDRLARGYVIDMIVFPWFVSNLADVYGNMMIACLLIEILSFKPARQMALKSSSADWRKELSFFARFTRGYLFGKGASRAHHRGEPYPDPR